MRNGGVKGLGFMGKEETEATKVFTDLAEEKFELVLEDLRKDLYAFFMSGKNTPYQKTVARTADSRGFVKMKVSISLSLT